MNNEQYFGTTVILESEPIDIPNTRQCQINHGLIAVIPFKDISFGVWKKKRES